MRAGHGFEAKNVELLRFLKSNSGFSQQHKYSKLHIFIKPSVVILNKKKMYNIRIISVPQISHILGEK